MQTSPLLTQLMEALRCLPGVGPKSAQRMAFALLQRDRSGGMRLAQSLTKAMSEIATVLIAAPSQNKKYATSVRIRVAGKTAKFAW